MNTPCFGQKLHLIFIWVIVFHDDQLKIAVDNLLEELRRRNIFQRNCAKIFLKIFVHSGKFFKPQKSLGIYALHNFLGLISTSALFDKKCPYPLLKPQKNMHIERCSVLNALNLEKLREKNLQLCPFTGLSCLILIIPI